MSSLIRIILLLQSSGTGNTTFLLPVNGLNIAKNRFCAKKPNSDDIKAFCDVSHFLL